MTLTPAQPALKFLKKPAVEVPNKILSVTSNQNVENQHHQRNMLVVVSLVTEGSMTKRNFIHMKANVNLSSINVINARKCSRTDFINPVTSAQ